MLENLTPPTSLLLRLPSLLSPLSSPLSPLPHSFRVGLYCGSSPPCAPLCPACPRSSWSSPRRACWGWAAQSMMPRTHSTLSVSTQFTIISSYPWSWSLIHFGATEVLRSLIHFGATEKCPLFGSHTLK